MVMTQPSKPRLSPVGALLAVAVACAGMAAAPARSCPPSDEASKNKDKATKTTIFLKADEADAPCPEAQAHSEHEIFVVGPEGDLVPCPGAEAAIVLQGEVQAAAHASPHEFHVGVAPSVFTAWSDGDDEDLERRMRRLEEKIARLTELVERQMMPPGAAAPSMQHPAPKPPRVGPVRRAPVALGRSGPALLVQPETDAEPIIRKYTLSSKGKLKELTALMVRSDVPVLVRPLDDGIEVHGSAHEHEVFQAFLYIIDPSEKRSAATLPLDELAKARPELEAARRALEETLQADGIRQTLKLKNLNRALELGEVTPRFLEDGRGVIELLRKKRDAFQNEADVLEREADELQKKAEQLRKKAEKIREKAGRSKEQARSEEFHHEADTLEHESEALEEQVAMLLDKVSVIEEQADAVDDQADAIEDELESVEWVEEEEAPEHEGDGSAR